MLIFIVFVLYLYIFFLPGSWCPFFYSTWELVLLFCVVILVFTLFFNYTPVEVVPPVGMLVYTAVYTLAGDGHVGRSRVRNPAPRY